MELNFGGLEVTAEAAERQLKKWSVLQQAARNKKNVAPAWTYRFITIARDRGSLGDDVALELSKRLQWHIFDKEIVTYIAKDSHVRESLVRQYEEHSENLVEEMISRFLKMTERGYIGDLEYHESLIKTMAYLAKNGAAIIVGRGANFVLREEKDGVNVLITASPEVRIQRISASMKMAPEEARRRMQADDEERRKFIRQNFRQDFENGKFYDIVFNTDHATAERVASAILGFMSRPAE